MKTIPEANTRERLHLQTTYLKKAEKENQDFESDMNKAIKFGNLK